MKKILLAILSIGLFLIAYVLLFHTIGDAGIILIGAFIIFLGLSIPIMYIKYYFKKSEYKIITYLGFILYWYIILGLILSYFNIHIFFVFDIKVIAIITIGLFLIRLVLSYKNKELYLNIIRWACVTLLSGTIIGLSRLVLGYFSYEMQHFIIYLTTVTLGINFLFITFNEFIIKNDK